MATQVKIEICKAIFHSMLFTISVTSVILKSPLKMNNKIETGKDVIKAPAEEDFDVGGKENRFMNRVDDIS